jgi:transposase InsO family protein
MTLPATLLEQIRRDIHSAPFKVKTARGKEWAQFVGMSYQNLCRSLNKTCKAKRQSTPSMPEYHEWARIVFAVKKSPPDGAGEISTDQAVRIAVEWGKLPGNALDVPIATYNRIARDLGLSKRERKVSRFQAERPNMLHHFDASSSKYLYINRKTTDGDYVLKIHRPGSGDYKNKPIPCDRLRPWYYGVIDDHSGRMHCSIFAAEGETALHSLQALCSAWTEMGLPDELLADQGMLKKALVSRDLIERLNIKLPESMPYAKEAHGKIERPWRTAWQRFEKPFYAGEWKKFEILLSEVKVQLGNYLNEYNQRAHRFETDITRMQAWSRVNLHGGIIQIPENALRTAAKRRERTIGQDGILQYEGKLYEVPELYNARVIVFEGVFDDLLVVQDKTDGKKYKVREFRPLNIGEYRSYEETPHQKLIKESAGMLTGSAPMLYANGGEQPRTEKIISMPTKVKEAREVADPFEVDRYASLKEAMSEFMEIVGAFVPPDQRKEVEELIQQNQLSKAFVTDLALEISASIESSKRKLIAI